MPMSIAEIEKKGNIEEIDTSELLRSEKPLFRLPDGVLTVAVVLLASSASFGLGMLAERERGGEREGVKIEQIGGGEGLSAGVSAALAPIPRVSSSGGTTKSSYTKKALPTGTATAETGKYVASKNGTKYYLPSCGTVSRIKEENKIYFNTKEEAEAAGFGPSSTCKGL